MFSKWIFPDNWNSWIATLSELLHQRSRWRLAAIFVGIIFAKGRKTITSWFRAAGISRRYQSFYYFIGSIGRKTEIVATTLFEIMIQRIYKNTNIVLTAIDDSPTVRYGPKVPGREFTATDTYAGRQKVRLWPCVGNFVGYCKA